MSSQLDTTAWSGEGTLTQQLIDWFSQQPSVTFLKVEDATATGADVNYIFVSNEIFLAFDTQERVERHRLWGLIPVSRRVADKVMTIEGIETLMAADEEIGPADYVDDTMIQYLRTERVIPPYQTKGYKLIELVRIYEVGTASRSPEAS